MTTRYKTREEAIEAAKLCLESGIDDDLETVGEDSKHIDTSECWCCPERVDAANGVIYIHRGIN